MKAGSRAHISLLLGRINSRPKSEKYRQKKKAPQGTNKSAKKLGRKQKKRNEPMKLIAQNEAATKLDWLCGPLDQ